MTTFVTVNKGILYILISGVCFIVVNFFVKLLGPGQEDLGLDLQDYPGHELVLARSIVSFAISYFVIKRKKLPLFGFNKKWLIIRGIAGMIALTIFFYTIHYLPMAIAATVQYLSPIFTVLFAMILLKERVHWLQWPFIALSFIGIAFIALGKSDSPAELGEISLFWLGLGILSAVLSGVAYVSIMKLKTTDAPITIVFYFPMISIPFMTFLCLFDFTVPRGIEWLFLILIGIFTQLAQITMTKALHEGPASKIVPFQYLGAVYAILLGYFTFDEKLQPFTMIGIGLIICGVVANAILRRT